MPNRLFGTNNHSQYKISWRPVDFGTKKAIEDLLLRHFPFSQILNLKQVREWEQMSNNFKVTAIAGGQPKEILFRKHIQLRDIKSLETLSEILLFLQSEKFAAPRIYLVKEKSPLFKSGANFYQAFQFLSGDHYRGTVSELREVARGIAWLHKIFLKAPISLQERVKRKSVLLPPWKFSDWNKIGNLARRGNRPIDKIFLDNYELILNTSTQAKNFFSGKSFGVQMIHADLHPHNFIFDQEKLKAILDFEGVRFGELMREVANACHRLVRQFVVYQRGDWRKNLSLGTNIFLKEYSGINPLSAKEILAIPAFIRDELLRKLLKDLRAFYLGGQDRFLIGGEFEKKLVLLREAGVIEKTLLK